MRIADISHQRHDRNTCFVEHLNTATHLGGVTGFQTNALATPLGNAGEDFSDLDVAHHLLRDKNAADKMYR